ncbi:M99 family carboxypeptidase catalytic domain-containing protein [Malaciobacter marinus]|uniref:Deacylase n=1 Tax=Malaciobacter marinus TaxID=505249 RepID=A0A347TPC2_9BACT|nr:M99 family carboxypeptidase catalytic domain-containing protein [Malaciobacter marinus]AXX88450.1 peptidoglycan peptidase 1 [Malaciobacter marinus]PHO14374.1 deacylase [Malaciobacter marinus]
MNLGILRLFSLILVFTSLISANTGKFDFTLIKKGQENQNTFLIIGGIQGDEPGGFMAASLIATHYEIKKGSVWIVPNLNFYSIIKRSRGPFGDMNRKFANLSQNDPDFGAVKRIKEYITDNKVKLILNLHDGSGFYRKKSINSNYSQNKWGQSSIIDQNKLTISNYGNLEEISSKVCNHINSNLIRKRDIYHVKNTKTRLGDKQMEKTLTYFAINKGKAAFGNEASKKLPLHERTYYHLLAIEKYMDIMGIEYKRSFNLKPLELKSVIDNDISISFYNNKINLPLEGIRDFVGYFPTSKDEIQNFKVSNPLMTVIKKENLYSIRYGNRRVARLLPDYFDIEKDMNSAKILIDGKESLINMGSVINVKNDFLVKSQKDIRVNIIGYVNKSKKNESELLVSKNEIMQKFSLDKKGKVYRVEFYKKNKFAGMVLVNFGSKNLFLAKNGY